MALLRYSCPLLSNISIFSHIIVNISSICVSVFLLYLCSLPPLPSLLLHISLRSSSFPRVSSTDSLHSLSPCNVTLLATSPISLIKIPCSPLLHFPLPRFPYSLLSPLRPLYSPLSSPLTPTPRCPHSPLPALLSLPSCHTHSRFFLPLSSSPALRTPLSRPYTSFFVVCFPYIPSLPYLFPFPAIPNSPLPSPCTVLCR